MDTAGAQSVNCDATLEVTTNEADWWQPDERPDTKKAKLEEIEVYTTDRKRLRRLDFGYKGTGSAIVATRRRLGCFRRSLLSRSICNIMMVIDGDEVVYSHDHGTTCKLGFPVAKIDPEAATIPRVE
jgi:hypothetical protein